MLSYIHAYHAGNHADILKHISISLILEHLKKKEKPFTVLDTHAGSGLYKIDDERLMKTGECEIESFIKKAEESADEEVAKIIGSYLSIVKKYLKERKYPGSPIIESELLREQDSQILSELHPKAIEELRENAKDFPKKPKIHFRDGYEMAISMTPPATKRGVVVIDPSFEDASDFSSCSEAIAKIHKKWMGGTIALWYPLVPHRVMEISMMKESIIAAVDSSEPKILEIELEVKDPAAMTGLSSLYGSGMFIVNFPYKMDEEMEETMPLLKECLGARSFSVTKR